MEKGEEKIRQEDCNEDNLGQGVLTLTNKRIAFDKTRGRIMDFAKKFGDTVLDVHLDKITKVWKEGFLIKKSLHHCRYSRRSKDIQIWRIGNRFMAQINTKRKR